VIPISAKADKVKAALFELSIDAWRAYVDTLPALPQAWLESVHHRPGAFALADSDERGGLSRQASAGIVFRLAQGLPRRTAIGLVFPCCRLGLLANLAVLLRGGTVVNLDPLQTGDDIRKAIERAGIRTVLTSRAYLQRLSKQGFEPQHALHGTEVRILDDPAPTPPVWSWLMLRLLPPTLLYRLLGQPVGLEATAAIICHSGNHGHPRGVMLSQRNIIANIRQIGEVLDVRSEDLMLASLPLSQALGLSVSGLLPLIPRWRTSVCSKVPLFSM